jgi:beta-N-acetylhexosaminidase
MKNEKVYFKVYAFLLLSSILCVAQDISRAQLPDDGWKQLTLREKIGQTVIMRSDSLPKKNMTDEELIAYLKKYPVGGVFEGGTVIFDSGPTADKIGDNIARLRKASHVPLIICGDMESGAGANVLGLTRITHLSGVGATRSNALAYDFGRATAMEARSIGFNWLFTPVADLVQNPFNYIVAERSISDDPRVATPLLISMVNGYQENGIAATAKHFPGDGVDYRNQHETTSCNALTRPAWKKNHGAVFQALIDNGVMAIMEGHISLPCYQSNSEIVDGQFLPATLSYDLTTKLLKQKMGFKGVVVTDALIMGGFIKFYGDDACVRSFQAGTDMLLWPPERYFDDMEKAIQSGRIPMSRLDDAVQRIWQLKQRLGLLNTNTPPTRALTDEDKNFIKKTAQDIAEKSITLVRDRNGLLPLNPSAIHNVAIVPISNEDERVNGAAEHLRSMFAHRGIAATIEHGLWLEKEPQVAAENDLIIYLVCEAGFQTWYGGKAQSDTWTYGMTGREKTIVVSLDNPFHSDEFASADTYINAYDASDVVIAALTRGLFGEIVFTGKSPDDLTMFRSFNLDPRAK